MKRWPGATPPESTTQARLKAVGCCYNVDMTDAIDRETLRLWSRRSDAPGLIHLAIHFGALLLTGIGIWLARGTFWLWPAMFVHGVVLIFLFTPLHECVHRTAFKTRALNEAVAFVIGVLIVL